MIVIGAMLLGIVIVYGAIEAIARSLFDHVDQPEGDETASEAVTPDLVSHSLGVGAIASRPVTAWGARVSVGP